MLQLHFDKIILQNLTGYWFSEKLVTVDVLRIDRMHPVISGNKYFKLKHYIQDALDKKKTTIATFGGAYSNHIIATAFACKQHGLESIGIIRGEESQTLSHTLQQARLLGMKLKFVTREDYRDKKKLELFFNKENWYWIEEGGYGIKGATGAGEILHFAPKNDYDYIVASVGTGTMLAGLILAAKPNQQIIGISSMKGNASLERDIANLVEKKNGATFTVFHDYHFGGYAKHPKMLIDFMNEVYQKFQLPLDIVYTSKAFYALKNLVEKNYFPAGSKVLFVHSGGLQGNRSLPSHTLSF